VETDRPNQFAGLSPWRQHRLARSYLRAAKADAAAGKPYAALRVDVWRIVIRRLAERWPG